MFAVILFNVFGFTVAAAMQSLISNAADPTTQGRTTGAVGSINSMMAVLAPVIAAPLLGVVSHLPRGDWRIGAPFYFCALLQAASLVVACATSAPAAPARGARGDAAASPRLT